MDREFWQPRGISTTDLLMEHQPCYSVHHYYLGDEIRYPKSYPCYALHFPHSGHTKLWCPNNPKGERFICSNTSADDVWQWKCKGGTTSCLINKAYKDGLETHKKVGTIDVFAFQSEGAMPLDTIERINATYSKKLILYDNDDPGRSAASRLAEAMPGAKAVFYPQHLGKDTDEVLTSGYEDFISPFIYQQLEMI